MKKGNGEIGPSHNVVLPFLSMFFGLNEDMLAFVEGLVLVDQFPIFHSHLAHCPTLTVSHYTAQAYITMYHTNYITYIPGAVRFLLAALVSLPYSSIHILREHLT